MMDGGNGDAGGVDVEIGGEEFGDRGEDGDGVFLRGVGCAFEVRFDGSGENNAGVGGFKLTIDAEVIASEGARAAYGNAEWIHYALPSTALRQRP